MVLGVAALLVVGLTRLLTAGGGDGGNDTAQVVRGEPTTALSSSLTTSPTFTTVVRPGKKGRLPQPEGACDPSDVLVTPSITDAHVAQPVRIVLEVTSLQSPACTFRVAPDTVVLRLLNPDRAFRSVRLRAKARMCANDQVLCHEEYCAYARDYFVKLLTEDDPEAEAKALRVHAMAEMFRSRLSGDQSDELKEFFAEEMGRATAALG